MEQVLPDDGLPIIETTGFEVIDDVPWQANDNDGARGGGGEARVLPFAAGLPRVK